MIEWKQSILQVEDKVKKDVLKVAGKTLKSRLIVGTGKYKDLSETKLAIEASGAEMVTVPIRRMNIGQDKNTPNLLEFIDPEIEALQEKIAKRLGYDLKDHRLELFGVPIKRTKDD